MNSKVIFSILFVISFSPLFAQEQFDPYPRDSLSGIFGRNADLIFPNLEMHAFRFPFACKAYVIYGDSSRPIPVAAKATIKEWATKVMRMDESTYNESIFTKEYLFYERGKAYWLPVQQGVQRIFASPKIVKGLGIDIFITIIGATSSELVATVNEIATPFPIKE